MTNNEWFNGLSVEEKAVFLVNFYRNNGEKLHLCVQLAGSFYPEQKRKLIEWLNEDHEKTGYINL